MEINCFDTVNVKEVRFLTPAKIDMTVGGEEITQVVSVDIVNRQVYLANGDEYQQLSKAVFEHLDSINTLPEDFFVAPQEIVQQAAKARSDYESMSSKCRGEFGETNE